MKLGAAGVFVRDIVEAKAFYTQRLGLTVEAADEEHGFCACSTLVPPSSSSRLSGAKTRRVMGWLAALPVSRSRLKTFNQSIVKAFPPPAWNSAAFRNGNTGVVGLQHSKIRRAMVFSSCSNRPDKLLQATRETRAPEHGG